MNHAKIQFPRTRRATQQGFALVISMIMMALLTLLAVGLLSLASVSLRSSTQGDAMARARANAKLALELALGDLQKQLGPDSRISVPQNQDDAAERDGQPHWTGVYDAWTSEEVEAPDSRSPNFRGWLVSGENQTESTEEIRLVSAAALGGNASIEDEVNVPMQTVIGDNQTGNFGWWISDEGVKAKVNAGPNNDSIASYGKADPLFDSQSPPHLDQTKIPELASFEWEDGKRALALSMPQLNLATGLAINSLGSSFHDVTVHSAGVLADVREGRLKRDLSNLLSRPAEEIENKPLYLANGKMNRFDISEDGAISNASGISESWVPGYNSANQWGINLEELYLFHNLHREIAWNRGKPTLAGKKSREEMVQDRYFMYRRPSIQGVQLIFSLRAVPDGADTYRMQMYLDGMAAISNPNDVPLSWAPDLLMPFHLQNLPYSLSLDIRREGATVATAPATQTRPDNFDLFKGFLGGGVDGIPQAGFTLEPGEAAVFGSSNAVGENLNLLRGFNPTGGVEIPNNKWNTQARQLKPTDTVDFEFTRTAAGNNWTYVGYWFGPRVGSTQGYQMDACGFTRGTGSGSRLINQFLPLSITSSQVRPVSDFVDKPQPVLMLSFLQNVGQDSRLGTPDAFASRPFQLNEPSLNGRWMNPDKLNEQRHALQALITAEAMNYQFRTLAAGDGGRNLYIGGGRQPNLGGSFNVISRRIPIAPPLSLGAFHNAIASGFCDRFDESSMRASVGGGTLIVPNDSWPRNAIGLTGNVHALPLVTQAIGNSYSNPNLGLNEVFSENAGTTAILCTDGKVATDHSWMINTALWDSWFLSGIVDGSGVGSSNLMPDSRTPRAQFEEFANSEKPLRNRRFIFYPHKTTEKALDELFDGANFDPSAISSLPKYLLVDGSFNVNSTSANAWKALLSSVRNHELLTQSGSTETFEHPFGTLGYAANTATSGTSGDWSGLRDLSDDDMERLAEEIVVEVKARGPFLSMADFVNRRPNSSDKEQQALGALQAAIDRSGLNGQFNGSLSVNPSDFSGLSGASNVNSEPEPTRAVGAAGHLSQADLLTVIGSQISARSDTFVIRTYGDARDASGEKVLARAWCEAVVQRTPEYLDPTDDPEAEDGWPSEASALSEVNSKFGRRFVIQSFRWLSKEEV